MDQESFPAPDRQPEIPLWIIREAGKDDSDTEAAADTLVQELLEREKLVDKLASLGVSSDEYKATMFQYQAVGKKIQQLKRERGLIADEGPAS